MWRCGASRNVRDADWRPFGRGRNKPCYVAAPVVRAVRRAGGNARTMRCIGMRFRRPPTGRTDDLYGSLSLSFGIGCGWHGQKPVIT